MKTRRGPGIPKVPLRAVTDRSKCDRPLEKDPRFMELHRILEEGQVDPGRLMRYLEQLEREESELDPVHQNGHHGQGREEQGLSLPDGQEALAEAPEAQEGVLSPVSLVKKTRGG